MLEKIEHEKEVIICQKAIDNWGEALQQVVAMEECSELVQAISKSIRGKEHNVEEEIADVEIMCTQLRLIFNNDKINEIKQIKLERLKGMVW